MGSAPDTPKVQTYRAPTVIDANALAAKRSSLGPSTRSTRSGDDEDEAGMLSRGGTLLAQGTQSLSRGKMGA